MPFRLDVGGVVVQHIKHVVALMLMRADNLGVDGDMVRYQRVGAYALVQPEIFWGMPRIDRVNLRFHTLAVATGMQRVLDIVQVEHREGRHRIRDGIVGGVQGFQAQVITRGRQHRWVPRPETSAILHKPMLVPIATMQASSSRKSGASLTYRSSTWLN